MRAEKAIFSYFADSANITRNTISGNIVNGIYSFYSRLNIGNNTFSCPTAWTGLSCTGGINNNIFGSPAATYAIAQYAPADITISGTPTVGANIYSNLIYGREFGVWMSANGRPVSIRSNTIWQSGVRSIYVTPYTNNTSLVGSSISIGTNTIKMSQNYGILVNDVNRFSKVRVFGNNVSEVVRGIEIDGRIHTNTPLRSPDTVLVRDNVVTAILGGVDAIGTAAYDLSNIDYIQNKVTSTGIGATFEYCSSVRILRNGLFQQGGTPPPTARLTGLHLFSIRDSSALFTNEESVVAGNNIGSQYAGILVHGNCNPLSMYCDTFSTATSASWLTCNIQFLANGAVGNQGSLAVGHDMAWSASTSLGANVNNKNAFFTNSPLSFTWFKTGAATHPTSASSPVGVAVLSPFLPSATARNCPASTPPLAARAAHASQDEALATLPAADKVGSAWPNPAYNTLTVRTGAATWVLRDIHGRTVATLPPGETEQSLSIEALPAGLYMAQWLEQDAPVQVSRIVIQHP